MKSTTSKAVLGLRKAGTVVFLLFFPVEQRNPVPVVAD
jgi:hypothetical protein